MNPPKPNYGDFHIILDVPTDFPGFGFDAYAAALTQVITTNEPRFAVGVFGTWGSGKTTLMTNVARSLDKNKIIAVDFSAWRFEKEPHLIVPLLDSIRAAVLTWSEGRKTLKDRAFETARTIGQATVALLHGFSLEAGVPGVVKASFEANKALEAAQGMDDATAEATVPRSFYQASFLALEEAFSALTDKGTKRRFIVFIDDLDRCLPEGALEVLESMKLFFDIPGFVFVVGLDQHVVERCIDAKYAKELAAGVETQQDLQIRGADYIKKIFQVPFHLPRVTLNQVADFVGLLCTHGGLPQSQQADLMARVQPHLGYLTTDAGINPRELKRYINAYTILMKVKPDLNPDAVLAIQTLTFRSDWTVALQILSNDREAFLQALRAKDPAAELAAYDDDLAELPTNFFRYFSNNGPGRALRDLDAVKLNDHLYSGQLTGKSAGSEVLDLVRHAAAVKRALRIDDANAAKKELAALESRLRDSSSRSPAQQQLMSRAIEPLRLRLASGKPTAKDLPAWRTDVLSLASNVVRQAREIYQSTA